jgi:hypothetical protein
MNFLEVIRELGSRANCHAKIQKAGDFQSYTAKIYPFEQKLLEL